eukprot:SAG22_NODE_4047_length_1407_cov_7.317278_2_plen_93_part_01
MPCSSRSPAGFLGELAQISLCWLPATPIAHFSLRVQRPTIRPTRPCVAISLARKDSRPGQHLGRQFAARLADQLVDSVVGQLQLWTLQHLPRS